MREIKTKGSIIVVDDEASVRDVVSRVLREEGYEVTSAASGREALEVTARRTFDLMFLDIRMPGMNGLDVLTLMSAGSPSTPVVMLTGVTSDDAENEAVQREAFAYLTKPCDLTEVTDIANKLLAEGAQAKNAKEYEESLLNSVADALRGTDRDAAIDTTDSVPSGSILVVDDEASVRDVVSRILKEEGYEVDTAVNGHEALKKADRQHFDLMFLDIRMPGMSGLEVLSEMAKKHPATTVIMLTAVESLSAQMESTQNEAFTYLTKPCDLSEVVDVANQLLSG